MSEINLQDHDLLIELKTEVRALRGDIKELKDGTAQQLSNLKDDHVTRKEHEDHETRIRFVEKYVWGAIAIIGLINLIGFGTVLVFLNK
jgi:hypothetical protein